MAQPARGDQRIADERLDRIVPIGQIYLLRDGRKHSQSLCGIHCWTGNADRGCLASFSLLPLLRGHRRMWLVEQLAAKTDKYRRREGELVDRLKTSRMPFLFLYLDQGSAVVYRLQACSPRAAKYYHWPSAFPSPRGG